MLAPLCVIATNEIKLLAVVKMLHSAIEPRFASIQHTIQKVQVGYTIGLEADDNGESGR